MNSFWINISETEKHLWEYSDPATLKPHLWKCVDSSTHDIWTCEWHVCVCMGGGSTSLRVCVSLWRRYPHHRHIWNVSDLKEENITRQWLTIHGLLQVVAIWNSIVFFFFVVFWFWGVCFVLFCVCFCFQRQSEITLVQCDYWLPRTLLTKSIVVQEFLRCALHIISAVK